MFARRFAQASALRSASKALPSQSLSVCQRRTFLPNWIKNFEERYPDEPKLTEAEDPGQNGGYINPPPIKKQFRDPYGDWDYKQERRNFGEPVHEDNDILGIFSTYEYTWISPGKGALQVAAAIGVGLGVVYLCYLTYPDKPSYPREFEGGLARELGGRSTVIARAPGDPEPFQTEKKA